jgi:hypothetical protein
MTEEDSFLLRLEFLTQEIESCTDPAARERLRGAIGILLDFHGRALARLMGLLRQSGDSGTAAINAMAGDDLVASLLSLHDLHPWDVHARLKQAIERAASQWASQGTRVELLGVTQDSIAQLRLTKVPTATPSSPAKLKKSIERIVYSAAPDISGVTLEGLEEAQTSIGFVPITALRICRAG